MPNEELRDLNTDHCTCGEDHNQLPHIIFAAFRLADYMLIPNTAEAISSKVEEIAREVGWQPGESTQHSLEEICHVILDTAGVDDTLGDLADKMIEQAGNNGWKLVRN